jgi:hypothetical protein
MFQNLITDPSSPPQRLAAEIVRGRSTGSYFDQHLDKYLDTTQLESWAQARLSEVTLMHLFNVHSSIIRLLLITLLR